MGATFYYYNDKLRIADTSPRRHVQEFNVDERRWEAARVDIIRGIPMIFVDGSHYIRVEDALETAMLHDIDPEEEQIKALREQGFSQKDIATMTGKSVYRVRKILGAERN